MHTRKSNVVYLFAATVIACTLSLLLHSHLYNNAGIDLAILALGQTIFTLALLYSVFAILNSNAGICLLLINFYFTMGVILPANHYIPSGKFPWAYGYTIFNNNDIVLTYAISSVFITILNISYYFFTPSSTRKHKPLDATHSTALSFIAIVVLGLGILAAAYAGPEYIFSKRLVLNQDLSNNLRFSVFKRSGLLIFVASIIFWTIFTIKKASNKKRAGTLTLCIISTTCLFIIVNPINSARWKLIGFTLAIFITLVMPNKRYIKASLYVSLSFAMIYLYPLLNAISRSEDQLNNLQNHGMIDYFNAGDFDGFQSIMTAVRYTKDVGFSFGERAFASIVSFVPRQLWTSKPEHSGYVTSEQYGSINTNLSMPVPGELYLDFGLIGILLGTTWLAYLLKKFDNSLTQARQLSLMTMSATVIASNTLFISRGALSAALEYVLTILIILALCLKLAKHSSKPMAK